jgi:hypothetical protein
MPIFPDITPDQGYSRKALSGTDIRNATSGKEWRRKSWPRNKQSFKMTWGTLSKADAAILGAFYDARQGQWESFTFFDFESRIWTGLACDETGTGSLTTFTLPAKSTSSQTVYVDGVEESADNYGIGSGTGTQDEDQVVFDAGHEPASGSVVTVTCTGNRRYTCRFEGEIEETTTEFGPSLSATVVEVF